MALVFALKRVGLSTPASLPDLETVTEAGFSRESSAGEEHERCLGQAPLVNVVASRL